MGEHPPEIQKYYVELCKTAWAFGLGVIEMCIRWAWTIKPDVAIVGCESPAQVEQVAQYWKRGELHGSCVERLLRIRKDVIEHDISPRMWDQRYQFTVGMN